jgi:hypothetical protein
MDFIYDRRPTWNFLYGNVFPYYDDMTYFLENNCELVHEFTSPYGMRIVRLYDEKEWKVSIYKVRR